LTKTCLGGRHEVLGLHGSPAPVFGSFHGRTQKEKEEEKEVDLKRKIHERMQAHRQDSQSPWLPECPFKSVQDGDQQKQRAWYTPVARPFDLIVVRVRTRRSHIQHCEARVNDRPSARPKPMKGWSRIMAIDDWKYSRRICHGSLMANRLNRLCQPKRLAKLAARAAVPLSAKSFRNEDSGAGHESTSMDDRYTMRQSKTPAGRWMLSRESGV
jgi:hypothetical protein